MPQIFYYQDENGIWQSTVYDNNGSTIYDTKTRYNYFEDSSMVYFPDDWNTIIFPEVVIKKVVITCPSCKDSIHITEESFDIPQLKVRTANNQVQLKCPKCNRWIPINDYNFQYIIVKNLSIQEVYVIRTTLFTPDTKTLHLIHNGNKIASIKVEYEGEQNIRKFNLDEIDFFVTECQNCGHQYSINDFMRENGHIGYFFKCKRCGFRQPISKLICPACHSKFRLMNGLLIEPNCEQQNFTTIITCPYCDYSYIASEKKPMNSIENWRKDNKIKEAKKYYLKGSN